MRMCSNNNPFVDPHDCTNPFLWRASWTGLNDDRPYVSLVHVRCWSADRPRRFVGGILGETRMVDDIPKSFCLWPSNNILRLVWSVSGIKWSLGESSLSVLGYCIQWTHVISIPSSPILLLQNSIIHTALPGSEIFG